MYAIAKKLFFASIVLFCLAPSASADVKIKSRSSFGGQQGSESTVYIKGKRQRMEMPGEMASITQCDLRRTLQLSGATKTYTISLFDDGTDAAAETRPASARTEPVRKGGIVTTTMTITDTGERKQMFGYTARRLKTSMVTESSPDACNKQKSRMETDGWYVDLNVEFDCYEKGATAYVPQQAGGCRDEYRMKQAGTGRTGYPVHVTTTIYGEDGSQPVTMTQEVLEISKATLDAALFEIPEGYREVKDPSEMYSASAMLAAARSGQDEDDDAGTSSAGRAGGTSSGGSTMPLNAGGTMNGAAASGAAPTGPKQPGVVRVGVVMPKATAAEGIDANSLAEAVKNTMVTYLSGPAVEVVQLQSRIPVQIDAEARQKECDFVVRTTVAHKKGGGGGFGMFKKIAPVAGGVVPYGGTTAGAVAHTVATTAIYTAADFSGNVKSKDELTLEYALQRTGGSSSPAKQLKAKAKSDGEDLISTLVEQAATAVLTEATRK